MSLSTIKLKQNELTDLGNLCTEIKGVYTDCGLVNNTYGYKIIKILNSIFESSKLKCNTVLFTNNTDKLLFGIHVSPIITDQECIAIVADDVTPIDIVNYNLEIDLKLFDKLNGLEVASYIIEEIGSVCCTDCLTEVRGYMDAILAKNGDYISLRDSANYTQVLTFGIKDTIRKITSLLYKDEDRIGTNIYSEALEIRDICVDIAGTIRSCIFGDEIVVTKPKMNILEWCLMVYKDIDMYFKMATHTLEDAKRVTGSQLEVKEIEDTINCINKAVSESTVMIYESLFGKLRRKGLRNIEDDLYEYKTRIKNCEDIDEAMYILRQINTRIGILEDYIESGEATDSDIARYREVINIYRALRTKLAEKKIGNKKQYGIFIDYDKLDQLDPPQL